jgi:hypothetical protein
MGMTTALAIETPGRGIDFAIETVTTPNPGPTDEKFKR